MTSRRTEQWMRAAIPLAAALAVIGGTSALLARATWERADFSFGNGVEVGSLDPALAAGQPEGRVVRFLFEGLCVRDPKTLAPLPGMAESWTISDDALRYTFTIRRNARWSNGDPVTAHDFVASFQRLLDPRTAAAYVQQLWYVKGARAYTTEVDRDGAPARPFDSVAIRAPDDFTLEMELESPTPYFLDVCAMPALCPVNTHSLAELARQFPDTWRVEWTKPGKLVTNGPYTLFERRINDRMRFVKSSAYWDAANVAFETVDCFAAEHPNTLLNLYLSGELDWITTVPTGSIPRLVGRDDFHPAPYLATYFYRINVTRPFLSDARVRRALALTVDRRAITAKVTKAGERPAWSLVPPGIDAYAGAAFAHSTESATPRDGDYDRDVLEARRLLAEAGYGSGARELPVVEVHFNTQSHHKDIAEVVADSWRKSLAIPVKLVNQEWKVYLDTQARVAYDVSRSSWIADYPDPNSFLEVFTSTNENNRTGWKNERYDELVRLGARTQGGARMAALAEAERILMEELPLIPIYSYVTKNLVDPRLGGFHDNALDEHLAKFWYWKDDAAIARERGAALDHAR